MTRAGQIAAATVAGASVGIAVALLTTAFDTHCGEPCSAEKLAALVSWCIGTALVFALAVWWCTTKRWPGRRTAVGGAAFSLLVVGAAFAHYVWVLHSEYRRLVDLAPVEVTTDFHHMVITTRELASAATVESPPIKRSIGAWQRCLVGLAMCDARPWRVEMLCKAGVIQVEESDWPSLALVPAENSAGVQPLKSTRFCEE